MRVSEIMTRSVVTCRPEQFASDAAGLMWEHDCGCVPITDASADGDLVGIVTDRDLCMAAYTRGLPLHEIRVDSIMAPVVQTCRPSDTLEEAERRMSEAKVRRIPIVGGAGEVVGILSLSDIARARERSRTARFLERLRGDVARTLAAITS